MWVCVCVWMCGCVDVWMCVQGEGYVRHWRRAPGVEVVVHDHPHHLRTRLLWQRQKLPGRDAALLAVAVVLRAHRAVRVVADHGEQQFGLVPHLLASGEVRARERTAAARVCARVCACACACAAAAADQLGHHRAVVPRGVERVDERQQGHAFALHAVVDIVVRAGDAGEPARVVREHPLRRSLARGQDVEVVLEHHAEDARRGHHHRHRGGGASPSRWWRAGDDYVCAGPCTQDL